MSIHEEIAQTIRNVMADLDAEAVGEVSPTLLANRTFAEFGSADMERHVRYAAIEHYKQMARRILAAKYQAEGDENPAHQGDLFSGALQQRYPRPHKRGVEPVYVPLEALTKEEAYWNAALLRRSADARTKHADALEAYVDRKFKGAA